mmetsp:Transcript_5801/g.7402  ORF Transcript_5801/g.7402 Transcript_5801/m.7402 type:complete len:97 (+) Transcript_5801:383-673(+)
MILNMKYHIITILKLKYHHTSHHIWLVTSIHLTELRDGENKCQPIEEEAEMAKIKNQELSKEVATLLQIELYKALSSLKSNEDKIKSSSKVNLRYI